ncbi:hypothetical protein BDN71DRAFT_1452259, partial [Pleurotus eryngii]
MPHRMSRCFSVAERNPGGSVRACGPMHITRSHAQLLKCETGLIFGRMRVYPMTKSRPWAAPSMAAPSRSVNSKMYARSSTGSLY